MAADPDSGLVPFTLVYAHRERQFCGVGHVGLSPAAAGRGDAGVYWHVEVLGRRAPRDAVLCVCRGTLEAWDVEARLTEIRSAGLARRVYEPVAVAAGEGGARAE